MTMHSDFGFQPLVVEAGQTVDVRLTIPMGTLNPHALYLPEAEGFYIHGVAVEQRDGTLRSQPMGDHIPGSWYKGDDSFKGRLVEWEQGHRFYLSVHNFMARRFTFYGCLHGLFVPFEIDRSLL